MFVAVLEKVSENLSRKFMEFYFSFLNIPILSLASWSYASKEFQFYTSGMSETFA